MLIVLLYFIPFFTCCLMGETKTQQLIEYFGKTRTRYFRVSKISGIPFSGRFWVAFLIIRTFHYPNYPTRNTRFTRMPRADSVVATANLPVCLDARQSLRCLCGVTTCAQGCCRSLLASLGCGSIYRNTGSNHDITNGLTASIFISKLLGFIVV